MADQWDAVATEAPTQSASPPVSAQPNQQPANDPWAAVASPVAEAPKLPDTSNVEKQAQDNVSAQDKSQPQTPSENLNTAMGYKVLDVPKPGDVLPQPIRQHINDCYANGTATTAADCMQSTIPAVAAAIKPAATATPLGTVARTVVLDQPAAIGGIAGGTLAATAAEPIAVAATALGGPLAGGAIEVAAGLTGAIAGAAPVQKVVDTLLDKFPEIADKMGVGKDQLLADAKNPNSQFIGNLISNLPYFTPQLASKAKMALMGAIGGGQEIAREWTSDEKFSAAKILAAATVMAVSNKETSAGKIITSGASNIGDKIASSYDAVRSAIATKLNIPESKVTNDHVDQTIAAAHPEEVYPTEQHYQDTAKVMGVPIEYLRKVNTETGVHPSQLFEDAKNNPAVAKDVAARIVPKEYDSLRTTIAEDTGLKNGHAESKMTVQTLPQQILMAIREGESGGTIPKSALSDVEQKALDEAGIHPDEEGLYDTAWATDELQRRVKTGELDKNMSRYDNSHIEDLEDRYNSSPNTAEKPPLNTPEELERMKRVFNMSPVSEEPPHHAQPSLAPKLSEEGSSASINPLAHIFNPVRQSESAENMATAIRQGRGPAARETALVGENLQKFSKLVNSLDEGDRLDLIHYMETRSKEGVTLNHPELQPIADAIRDIYQQMAEKVKAAFPDTGMIQDYFTHQFKDRSAAKKFFREFVAKQGSERSLKERSFPTLREAMTEGKLEPKTTNPLETVMNYVRNMNNLIAAHESLKIAQEGGIADYFRRGQEPDGWIPLNGNLAEKDGKILYSPEDAARIYNNDVSEKATGPIGKIFDAVQHGTNFVDKLVLGLSGYHAVATTMASMSSDVGRALSGGSLGERISDLGRAATLAPFKNLALGKEIENAYLGREQLSPELQKALDLAIKNNAINVKQQDYWKAGPAKDYIDSFKNGTLLSDFKQAGQEIKQKPLVGTAKVILTEVGRTMDTVVKPLFDIYIPRMKNAALIQEAHDWLQQHPDATEAEKSKAVQDIGNSMDNRFGEMMRDNLFWHQYTRQTLQTALLSYSWVTGAARMLGGIPDAGMALIGKKELSSNAKYLLGMAATYAVINGARTYLGTGKPPDDWKDFIYPRTGGVTPQGKPERELLPSHIGQFTNYLHDGIGELGNEASPALKLVYHLLANKDFRGLPITNDNNEWYSEQRWGDYLQYVLHEITPLGLKSFLQGEKKGSNISAIEQLLGVRPAPEFITDPEGYKAMMEKVNNRAYAKKQASDKRMQAQYEASDE